MNLFYWFCILKWSGRQPPPCIDAPPTLQLLKHTITQVYNRAITKPEELNTYQAFSPEVIMLIMNIMMLITVEPLTTRL